MALPATQSLRAAVATRSRRAAIALTPRPRAPFFDIEGARPRLTRLLNENVVPFWVTRAVDPDGGYHEQFDASGVALDSVKKHALTQSRTLWFFSRLLATPYATVGMEASAVHGFDYLRSAFWDQKRGGVFATRNRSGAHQPVKHFYDQVMALDALTEFATATGSTDSRALANDLITLIQNRFHDPEGGYFEGLAEDWAFPEANAGLLVVDPSHKTISTHLNALNVLASVHSQGYGDLAGQIRELIELVDVRAILPGSHLMGERFTRDWSAVIGPSSVSYGHDLERIWMAERSRRSVGAPETDRRHAFDELVRWGWDRRGGGFYFGGAPGVPARDLRKQWWVQGEALVACLEYARSGSPQGLGFFERTLAWIEKGQADWERGEWHDTIDVLGRPRGEKGWTWKTGYHTARSLLEALDLLSAIAATD